jgi:hypothetical protein
LVVWNVFCDYCEDWFPHAILAILSSYRFPMVIHYIWKNWDSKKPTDEYRKECLNQFWFFLVDLPMILSAITLIVTVYRCSNMIQRIKKRDVGDSIHRSVFDEFSLFWGDLPYIMCGLLSLWRIPFIAVISKNILEMLPRNSLFAACWIFQHSCH